MKTLLCLVTIALAGSTAALAHNAPPVRCAAPVVNCQRPLTVTVRTVPVCPPSCAPAACPVPLSAAYWCRPALPINTYCVPSSQPPMYSVQSLPCNPVRVVLPCRVRGW